MPQSYTCLRYHVIFSTKDRMPLLRPEVQPRLWEYFGGILRSTKGILLAAGGMPDHVHILVGLNQTVCIADAVRVLKANSSGWIHDAFADLGGFAWQNGYGAFTVSHSGLKSVKAYIARQEEHHRMRTFKEEFVEFLNRHEIEYDLRYLWE